MRKSAFTMIELIFVIVILGILAVVALPRLDAVQDDALVASEQTGIGSARSTLTAIRGRGIMRSGANVSWDVANTDGSTGVVNFTGVDGTATGISTSFFPNALSIQADAINPLPSVAGALTSGLAMALVLDVEGRAAYATTGDVNTTRIVGPASSKISSESAQYNTLGSWSYRPATGLVQWDGNTTF